MSPEATPADEGPDRRFAVDRLMPFPFSDLPRTEAALKERYAEDADGGRTPALARSRSPTRAWWRPSAPGTRTRILAESDALAGW